MRGLGVVLVTLAGCNYVFDLQPTQVIDAGAGDVDDDGVIDELDNCPTIANDQTNTDGDAFGDACDTCPMFASATSHDEDRDRTGDDCDPCPGVPDFGEDSDRDGVGDICDPAPSSLTQNRRVYFEPFATMPASWLADTVEWTSSDDTVAPVSDLPSADRGLRDPAITTSGTWSADIAVSSRTHWKSPDRFAIVASGSGHTVVCGVACPSGTTCSGTLTIDGTQAGGSVNVTPRPYMHLRLIVRTAGTAFCLFEGISSSPSGSVPTAGLTLALIASPRIHVAYFDYIE